MEEALIVLKRISIAVSIITLIAVIIIAAYKIRQIFWIAKIVMEDEPGYSKSKAQQEWHEIMLALDTDDEERLQLAIIGADNMVDRVLQGLQFDGRDFEDRLRMAYKKGQPSVEELWRAHKTRIHIERQPDNVSKVLARQTVNRIERVFKEWDVL